MKTIFITTLTNQNFRHSVVKKDLESFVGKKIPRTITLKNTFQKGNPPNCL
jgi:hypothetical protein